MENLKFVSATIYIHTHTHIQRILVRERENHKAIKMMSCFCYIKNKAATAATAIRRTPAERTTEAF